MTDSATAKDRLDRARAFAVLGRPDEALPILKPVAQTDVAACLLLAAVLQGDERWQESSHYYRTALQMLHATPAHDSATLANRVKAYDSLAFNAREQGAYQDAEAIYFEALAALAVCECALSTTSLAGIINKRARPALAIEHLETAARLTPDPYAKLSQPLIDQMNSARQPAYCAGCPPVAEGKGLKDRAGRWNAAGFLTWAEKRR